MAVNVDSAARNWGHFSYKDATKGSVLLFVVLLVAINIFLKKRMQNARTDNKAIADKKTRVF